MQPHRLKRTPLNSEPQHSADVKEARAGTQGRQESGVPLDAGEDNRCVHRWIQEAVSAESMR